MGPKGHSNKSAGPCDHKRENRRFSKVNLQKYSLIQLVLAMLAIIWALFAWVSREVNANPSFYQSRQSPQCTEAAFTSALPTGASIERVESVPENGTYGEGSSNLGYPGMVMRLPELCAIIVNVTSSPTSSYRFGLFLPSPINWNTKFLAVGNGEFLGGINWVGMGPGPHYGMATLSTDSGHNSGPGDLSWALNAPEKQLDWASRAVHGSVQIGKVLTQAYYGQAISYSYWSGCSTGGRQGLKEIQGSPESFDGALVGAPAWDTKNIMPWVTRLGTLNLPESDPKAFTNISEFQLLAATVMAQCDQQDGLKDNIISSPESCDLDLSVIECGQPNVDTKNCLRPEQIDTAKEIYSDYFTGQGDFVYNGLEISSEEQWYVYQAVGSPAGFDTEYEKYFLYNDPAWNWTQYNDSVVYDSRAKNPGNATADQFDISGFRKAGGKVIMYQGMSDGLISSRSSTRYYNRTKKAMGGDVDDFFRYFQVPGMLHCFLTPVTSNAPWNFGGEGQVAAMGNFSDGWSVPGFKDTKHDVLLALMDWVENGTAVDSVVATTWNVTGSNSIEVYRQRPLCHYPHKATYDGSGDKNEASSWACT